MNVRPDFVNLQDKSMGIEEKCFTATHVSAKASTMHVLCPGLVSKRIYNDFKFTNDSVFFGVIFVTFQTSSTKTYLNKLRRLWVTL